jgi:hypothetical protein
MSWKDHQPTDWGWRQKHCIWCHEPWPCPTAKVAAEVLKDVITEVGPKGAEPMDSDISFERWQTREFVVDEIKDMFPPKELR